MGVASDILRAYAAPREVFRARAGEQPREDRALVILMVACLLIFVGRWPALQREAIETGNEFEMLVGATLLAWLFIMPLVAYAVGTISHLIARPFGGGGSAYSARFALFWALLVASPLWLLAGLTEGFTGPGLQTRIVGAVALLAFILHWGINLSVAERR
ncbi:YIP1 family protein [Sinisalibacter aestuarii]|uniref:YIP1 family protein n=1 Tax=Sinisalibacter aestuarii TaxID=2949426 RepID=A0ABQ5LSC8_9RHOB|nr:YIP1 family protein [Sinisalibacter aestuarii]GKY87643.1 hypothetical protein STA1M1_15120 [Sinisalibacter aestuarii]